ncbi:DUF3099 domain-containing protein [Ornithinimicrobium sp. EGI L100131]|jgi:hypothetical protein|nr:DUF3099 domain-containing protein [Ornithinimicrobium sediminis]
MRTYLIAMTIRIVSFPLAVLALLDGRIVVGSLLATAAIFIPSFAVMLANNVDHRRDQPAPVSPVRRLDVGPHQT